MTTDLLTTALSLACPTCPAGPGQRCRTSSRQGHQARRLIAARMLACSWAEHGAPADHQHVEPHVEITISDGIPIAGAKQILRRNFTPGPIRVDRDLVHRHRGWLDSEPGPLPEWITVLSDEAGHETERWYLAPTPAVAQF